MRAILVLAILTACAAPTPDPACRVTAVQHADRLAIAVGDQPFTEYRFRPEQKYPYFFPVLGPRSGASLTTESADPYPHHHSLFFACDRVNGGNYWQEGLERGQIRQETFTLERAGGDAVVFVTENLWHRPGADAPCRDRRRITVTAPSADQRCIDVDITWTALLPLRIERTNHALFAARMAPAFAPNAGGVLVNAAGALGEKATFGQASAWMDCSAVTAPGVTEGLAILVHSDNPWTPTPWFTRDYGFFSPTPMHWLREGFVTLPAGESWHLRYRVLIHVGSADEAGIAAAYAAW